MARSFWLIIGALLIGDNGYPATASELSLHSTDLSRAGLRAENHLAGRGFRACKGPVVLTLRGRHGWPYMYLRPPGIPHTV